MIITNNYHQQHFVFFFNIQFVVIKAPLKTRTQNNVFACSWIQLGTLPISISNIILYIHVLSNH